ncbi:MAG: sigma-E factor negative regulatory protein [Gammaproteobacteria bacterium]|nr:sigma-E factor negative regulatory protein [Gammaproteobacteria bacterium]MCP5424364.1 sigma-E factor negative regulatory protein [Gammaproteobacteria bacterium]MCP5459115.1 sigma-E factor negative regulatory protein [Gammaproteobacteria bacterium]
MADISKEQLSALMDGECVMPEQELVLRRLAKDAELRVCWQHYHMISDALKSNVPDVIGVDFAERISRLIVADPPLSTETSPRPSTWSKPLTGFALAASVALVAFAGLKLTQPQINLEPQNLASDQTISSDASNVTQLASSNTALEAKLNNYLVSHNEYASMHSVHGVLPYVRMVGYQPNP